MSVEHPLKYANILLMKLFWVTGKEVTYMDGRENRFTIKLKRPI
jgi:hypothetical protein